MTSTPCAHHRRHQRHRRRHRRAHSCATARASPSPARPTPNSRPRARHAGRDAAALDVRDGAAVAAQVGDAGAARRAGQLRRRPPARRRARAGGVRRRGRHQPQRQHAHLRGGARAPRERGGCIVNTASMLSFFGGALVPGYSREQGRRGAADQVAGHRLCGRRHPRQRDRARLDRHALTQALQDDPARAEAILARTPLGAGDDRTTSPAVLFLASPAARLRHRRHPARRRRLPDHLTTTRPSNARQQLPGIRPEIAIAGDSR